MRVKSKRALRFSTEHTLLRPKAPGQMLELKGPTPSVGADLGKGDKMHTIIRGNMGNLGKPKSSSSQKSSWAISNEIWCSKMWRSSFAKRNPAKKKVVYV